MSNWITKYEENKEPERRNLSVKETKEYFEKQESWSRSTTEVAKEAIAAIKTQLETVPKYKMLVTYNEVQAEIDRVYYSKMFKIKDMGQIMREANKDE